MIKITLFILMSLSSVLSSAETYIYPEKIHVDLTCDENIKELKIIQENASNFLDLLDCPHSGPMPIVKAYDLNTDGQCEYFITASWGRRCSPITKVINVADGELKEVFSYLGSDITTYASKRNDYYRLIHPTLVGLNVSPIYTTNIYYFDGENYTCEFCKENTHGGYIDLAKKAYDTKDFKLSEVYYWNAYAMNGENKLSDANNLALVYIKRNRFEKAIELLDKFLIKDDIEIARNEKINCGYCTASTNIDITRIKKSALFNRNMAAKKLKAIK